MIKYPRFTSTHLSFAAMALAIAAVAGSGSANAATASANTSSTVVTPIAIAAVGTVGFGSFSPSTGGTVVISPDGTRTVTGAVVQLAGATSAARFDVTGMASEGYTISFGGPGVLTRDGGTETMAFAPISALTESGATSGNISAGTLSAGGAQSFYVGGILTVASGQVGGTYAGSVSATVEYD